ncbi:hypothetical protein MHLP_00535 [Candidatus Mycoplasma haematolamae str. Purdue]|uniref:Phosphate ABC transporter substrate-binding protein n=1 Tax=Mycoplasma haematolamae (strain Purdue) TaxID=1212765 RepID=I7C5A2_MYCHA|nr:hypothetical protein [Candidatus Mycoplasma haematolamae]AFO51687.1 hypothetical protein MHLP_00535 [Candidatus Mycoplasma haematolamae str. Purdue]
MTKAKFLASLFGIGGIQGATLLSLNAHDSSKERTVITLEGSGSLYEPIKLLSKNLGQSIEVSIIPTGSSGGKESFKGSYVDFALSSFDNSQQQGKEQSQDFELASLAEDPIFFLYKKHPSCGQEVKYEDQNKQKLFSLFKGQEQQNQEFASCKFWSAFLREGGKDRSSLNKILLSNGQGQDSSSSSESSLKIREVSENNFLALETFLREGYEGSIIFFPESFLTSNKEFFDSLEHKGYKTFKTTSVSSSSQGSNLSKKLQIVLKKEKLKDKASVKDWLKKLLLQTQQLSKSLGLKHQAYHENGQGNGQQSNGQSKDVKTIIGDEGEKQR